MDETLANGVSSSPDFAHSQLYASQFLWDLIFYLGQFMSVWDVDLTFRILNLDK